jgi:hypothetical protein
MVVMTADGSSGKNPFRELSLEELVADRDGPDELFALAKRVDRLGGCRHPVRLVGKSDDGGYETSHEPDGVLLIPCGSRHASRCPSCAAIYRGDARHIVLSGLQGGKGVPESVANHPLVFFTLTAPSHGSVHSAKAGGMPCHFGPPGRCEHGRQRHCLERHQRGEEIVGAPLCPDCYRYEEAVLFNSRAGELWRRVQIYCFRHLAYALGTTEKELRTRVRLSFAKCVEFQARGAVHIHGVLRADSPDDELSPAPAEITANLLCQAIVSAAYSASLTDTTSDGEILTLRFGTQLQVAPVAVDANRKIANYLSKYCTKSADQASILDHRVREGELGLLDLPDHTLRLVRTAFELGRTKEHQRCGRFAHALGWSGPPLTKSRRYSTTFCQLRAARRAWREDESGESERTGTTTWTFAGTGFRYEIDRMLARGAEGRFALGRDIAYANWCESRSRGAP